MAVSDGETGISGKDGVGVLGVHDEEGCDGGEAGATSTGCWGAEITGTGDNDEEGNDESPESISWR